MNVPVYTRESFRLTDSWDIIKMGLMKPGDSLTEMSHVHTNWWDLVLALLNILVETTTVKQTAVKFLRLDHNSEDENIIAIFILVGCILFRYIITLFKICLQSQLNYSCYFIFHNKFRPLRAIFKWNTISIFFPKCRQNCNRSVILYCLLMRCELIQHLLTVLRSELK
jgi:hypothetical protein